MHVVLLEFFGLQNGVGSSNGDISGWGKFKMAAGGHFGKFKRRMCNALSNSLYVYARIR